MSSPRLDDRAELCALLRCEQAIHRLHRRPVVRADACVHRCGGRADPFQPHGVLTNGQSLTAPLPAQGHHALHQRFVGPCEAFPYCGEAIELRGGESELILVFEQELEGTLRDLGLAAATQFLSSGPSGAPDAQNDHEYADW